MALRSLDNALPADLQRPKKIAKIVPAPNLPTDPSINDENGAPAVPKATDPSPEYILSEDLKALTDPSPEYILSEDLKALTDPEAKIQSLKKELDSKDWVKVCDSLNDGRRLAIHHPTILLPVLENVLLVMVKSMKNPRSALCKTAIMASTDVFRAYGLVLLLTSEYTAAFDQLLLQLLLKASQDKKFVCEEAERALDSMAVSISPIPLLVKLQSHVSHNNMRVRAKAAVAISKCTSKMDAETMKEFGLAKLLQMAAELLSDRLPEAREAARTIINSIYAGFSVGNDRKDEGDLVEDEEVSTRDTWMDFCSSNLPPISAQLVAKIVSQ